MADEIKPSFGMNYLAGSGTTQDRHRRAGVPTAKTQTVTGRVASRMSIATSSTALDKGAISANVGFVWFKNIDATNYVQFSEDGTNWFGKVLPGEEAAFPTDVAAVYLKANTGACECIYELYAK